MSELQWALLVLAIAAVVAIYWYSRGSAAARDRNEPESEGDQMDLWSAPGGSGAQFDEFGVGEPRRRSAPELDPAAPTASGLDAVPTEAVGEGAGAAASAPPLATEQKIVSFYIAEREGTYILGPQIHRALQRQGLIFGERKIYHRLHDGHPVFAVASLLKPGELDPEQAEGFSTPGLSVFMVLPCGREPESAFADMLSTAQALASELHAELYDADRLPLTEDKARALRFEVSEWARYAGTPA